MNGEVSTEKLFVYGIFLGEGNRKRFGMSNPEYATVRGYLTRGDYIVCAYPVKDKNTTLTGLLVDMDSSGWEQLDRLEHGYDRVKVTTTSGEEAWMYQGKYWQEQ